MCGIAGIVRHHQPVSEAILAKMTHCLAHRGPDESGVWCNNKKNVGLGQRRLAIIDLSPGGRQPMVSPDGRFVITFNGEIYNYKDIRTELARGGVVCQTQSDTEVLLLAYSTWQEKCLEKLNGMFAFAIWDNKTERLFAARDPIGEKPFKYFYDGERLVFASELKAILTDPSVPREVDWQAVDAALTYRFVPAPGTGFRGIAKLPAGHTLVWESGKITITPYWQAKQFAIENANRSLPEWKTILWNTFCDSVKGRMMADVPIGAFLSGGLDSSSVVAAMAELAPGKVKTFSVGFINCSDSEIPFAKLVADRYKTEHTEIFIEPNVIELLPQLVYHNEEPFFDNASVPTLVMAKETKKFVTVVLTGDGGDELFGGYTNHRFFRQLRLYQQLPRPVYERMLPALARLAAGLTTSKKLEKLWYRSELLSHPLVQAYVDYYAIWKKELKQSHFYLTKDDLYTDELKHRLDLQYTETLMSTWLALADVPRYGDMNRAMLADIMGRLPDNYLMKVDYASMAYALENRAPFLDPKLVELALQLPETYKYRAGTVKWIWKQIMQDKLPEAIIRRPKAGFGIPIGSWMRQELYEYVHDSLIRAESPMYQYFKKDCIVRLLEDHRRGVADYSNHLWCLLLTEQWLRTFFV